MRLHSFPTRRSSDLDAEAGDANEPIPEPPRIDKLPPRQRSAIMLTYGEGMSNAEVAEILDTSVSAIETLLVRGKQNLRRALSNLIDKDE